MRRLFGESSPEKVASSEEGVGMEDYLKNQIHIIIPQNQVVAYLEVNQQFY